MKKIIKFKKINIFAPFFFFLGSFCHSRAGENPDSITKNLDSRLRGNDRGDANKFKKLVLYAVILCLTLPVVTFAVTRGQDGYNYYDNNTTSIGGSVFGGSNFGSGGGGLSCSGGSSNPTFCSLVSFFVNLISKVIPILISISVIVFVWGVFRYVIADGEDREKSRNVMMYGIIGLFVMVSVWGLVAVVTNTFNLENTNIFYFNYGRSGYGGRIGY